MKKILVIEGQAKTRNLFLKGLKAQGFWTVSAETGQVGIQKAQECLPDVITCAIRMPDLDGFDILTSLRQKPATAVIPFIFVTDKEARTDRRKAMELGANDYLVKPCTLDELLGTIAAQLKKQTTLQHWYTTQPNGIVETSSIQPKSIELSEWRWPSNSQLSEVFQFIEANYHRPITLTDIANAVGYSPAYLTNLIGRQTGQTVHRWIIGRRMAAARSLLLETDEIMEHIAMKVGYHNVVHFFRQFRQFHGTTPQAWRSAHRSLTL